MKRARNVWEPEFVVWCGMAEGFVWLAFGFRFGLSPSLRSRACISSPILGKMVWGLRTEAGRGSHWALSTRSGKSCWGWMETGTGKPREEDLGLGNWCLQVLRERIIRDRLGISTWLAGWTNTTYQDRGLGATQGLSGAEVWISQEKKLE